MLWLLIVVDMQMDLVQINSDIGECAANTTSSTLSNPMVQCNYHPSSLLKRQP